MSEIVGATADVDIVMPLGADPHDFAAGARQAEAMEAADLLVINGAGFEEGMADVIEQAAAGGTPVFDAAAQLQLVDGDPHLWMDPTRMNTVVEALGERLAELPGVDAAAVVGRADDYREQLEALDDEMAATLATVAEDERVLVTNHEVLGYFAERFGFEVLGAVIPSRSTGAQASAGELEQLALTVRDAGVGAIFGETTQPVELAEALAAEVGGDVEVIELFTESLGEAGSGAETYVDMMRTNAQLVADGLS
ncbi:MAG: metal ABC transporter solute-binding protein, Zn/Mn family [Ilumatobacteraceae bacterium]